MASIRDIADPARPSSLGSLEVELKSGRVIHARDVGARRCAILHGPAGIEPRRWRDLTAKLPFAFARDAVVSLAEPVKLNRRVVGLRVMFTGGPQFVYEISGGRPQLTTSIEDISGVKP